MGASAPQNTIRATVLRIAAEFDTHELWYGHGTADSLDEAAALVLHVAGCLGEPEKTDYDALLSAGQLAEIENLKTARISSRKPLPYLLGEAWFAGLPFTVDERVLIPRSPFAELIRDRFSPWLAGSPRRILELGTGSGCIAIACALAFPDAEVVATDISSDALAVAALNVQRHGVADRLSLLEADLFDGVTGTFDLIVTNPPYVAHEEVISLPAEYNHEPVLALESGVDGLDASRQILAGARSFLNPDGVLFLEVGAYWEALDEAFPALPFMWLDFEHGGEGVAMIAAADLPQAAD